MRRNGMDFWKSLSQVDLSLSLMGRFWQLLMGFFVGGGGVVTALVARTDPTFKELGSIYWIVVGVVVSVLIAFAFNLVRSAALKQEMANYYAAISTPRSTINPLADTFSDVVISVEDMRLPGVQEHKNKFFKRCKFVGPSTIVIIGGNIADVNFHDCGHVIALQDGTFLTGVISLHSCSLQECEFYNMTILADQNTARAFRDSGVKVSGLPES